jgi:multidrug efflux pump subunit AcrA (membrane-fusion protein)
MTLSKKSTVISFMILIIILAGIALAIHHQTKNKWVAVKQAAIVNAAYGLGTVESQNVFTLTAGITNYIKKIYVNAGDHVSKGSKLLMYHDGQIVTAPFDGVISSKPTYANEITNPQSVLLTLTDLNDRYFLVSMDQDSILRIENAKKAIINFEALPNKKYYGAVESTYSNNANFYVRIKPDYLPPNILPGMTADIAIIVSKSKQSILVPLTAIKLGRVIYRVNNVESSVAVKVGQQQNGWAQIISDNVPVQAEVLVS